MIVEATSARIPGVMLLCLIAAVVTICTSHPCAAQATKPAPATREEPPAKLSDLFAASIENGLVKLDSSYHGSATRIAGFDEGVFSIDRDKDNILNALTVEVSNSADGVQLNQSIQLQANRLMISRSESRGGAYRSISLTQISVPNGMRMMRAQPRFTLRVYEDTMQNGRTLVATIHSDTFDELVQYNFFEAELFIRPMLHDLQIEDLMGPADVQGLQVFSKEAPASPAIVKQIQSVVRRLDAESADERDAATKQLKSMGGAAIVVLMNTDRASLSPEQTTRVDAICAAAKVIGPDQAQTLRKDIRFDITCLASENRDLRAAALAALNEVTGKKVNFNANADRAARAIALDRLRGDLLNQ